MAFLGNQGGECLRVLIIHVLKSFFIEKALAYIPNYLRIEMIRVFFFFLVFFFGKSL